jgi:ankyrin repeat protein
MAFAAAPNDACFSAKMFDKSSIQCRAKEFCIQKSPIASKITNSSKPRFSAVPKPPLVLAASPANLHRLVSAALESPKAFEALGCKPKDDICIRNGFCVQLDSAARRGDVDVINRCIQAGADLNQKTVLSKQTPLHACLLFNQRAALVLLVTKGADIYAVSLFSCLAYLVRSCVGLDSECSAIQKDAPQSGSHRFSQRETLPLLCSS